jgi:hypothetical protein
MKYNPPSEEVLAAKLLKADEGKAELVVRGKECVRSRRKYLRKFFFARAQVHKSFLSFSMFPENESFCICAEI